MVIALAVVIGVVVSAGSPSPTNAATSPGDVSGATTVQRRDLVETDTESGTVSYSDPQTVYDRVSGTITWLPSVGQEIKQGQALFRVDGAPVILMNGTTPAYRDLNPSDSDGVEVFQGSLGETPTGSLSLGQIVFLRQPRRAGAGATEVYSLTKNEPFVVPLYALVAAPTAGFAIGALAGLYPAAKAARLSPTEALRA